MSSDDTARSLVPLEETRRVGDAIDRLRAEVAGDLTAETPIHLAYDFVDRAHAVVVDAMAKTPREMRARAYGLIDACVDACEEERRAMDDDCLKVNRERSRAFLSIDLVDLVLRHEPDESLRRGLVSNFNRLMRCVRTARELERAIATIEVLAKDADARVAATVSSVKDAMDVVEDDVAEELCERIIELYSSLKYLLHHKHHAVRAEAVRACGAIASARHNLRNGRVHDGFTCDMLHLAARDKPNVRRVVMVVAHEYVFARLEHCRDAKSRIEDAGMLLTFLVCVASDKGNAPDVTKKLCDEFFSGISESISAKVIESMLTVLVTDGIWQDHLKRPQLAQVQAKTLSLAIRYAGAASDASISKFMQALPFMREVTRESLTECVDALFTHSASFPQKWFELLCDHAERWQSRDISLIRIFIESAKKRNLAFDRERVSRLSCAIFKLLARDNDDVTAIDRDDCVEIAKMFSPAADGSIRATEYDCSLPTLLQSIRIVAASKTPSSGGATHDDDVIPPFADERQVEETLRVFTTALRQPTPFDESVVALQRSVIGASAIKSLSPFFASCLKRHSEEGFNAERLRDGIRAFDAYLTHPTRDVVFEHASDFVAILSAPLGALLQCFQTLWRMRSHAARELRSAVARCFACFDRNEIRRAFLRAWMGFGDDDDVRGALVEMLRRRAADHSDSAVNACFSMFERELLRCTETTAAKASLLNDFFCAHARGIESGDTTDRRAATACLALVVNEYLNYGVSIEQPFENILVFLDDDDEVIRHQLSAVFTRAHKRHPDFVEKLLSRKETEMFTHDRCSSLRTSLLGGKSLR